MAKRQQYRRLFRLNGFILRARIFHAFPLDGETERSCAVFLYFFFFFFISVFVLCRVTSRPRVACPLIRDQPISESIQTRLAEEKEAGRALIRSIGFVFSARFKLAPKCVPQWILFLFRVTTLSGRQVSTIANYFVLFPIQSFSSSFSEF